MESLLLLKSFVEEMEDTLKAFVVCYLLAEILFYIVFKYVLIPKANQRLVGQPYRPPYEKTRYKMFTNIFTRILHDRGYHIEHDDYVQIRQVTRDYMVSWFYPSVYYGNQQESEPPQVQEESEELSDKSPPSSSTSTEDVDDDPLLDLPDTPLIPPFWPMMMMRAASVVSNTSSANTTTSTSSSTLSLDTGSVGSDSDISHHQVLQQQQQPTREDELVATAKGWLTSSLLNADLTSKPYFTIPGMYKESLDDFLAWALFAKYTHELIEWEISELDKCYHYIDTHFKIQLDSLKEKAAATCNEPIPYWKPHRISFEDVNPWHRPFAVYFGILCLQYAAYIVFWLLGFRRVNSAENGVSGWYRGPSTLSNNNEGSSSDDDSSLPPMVFFHGIAPAGLTFYLPMIWYLARGRQHVLLIENPNISCQIRFHATTETELVAGVQELVDRYFPSNNCPFSIVGHSFGSCPVTWLLTMSSPQFRRRIRQATLLDPVTICLSEPDVPLNFLYKTSAFSKVRMIASSELFVEYYLRRQFAWYNSELDLHEVWEEDDHNDNSSGEDAQHADHRLRRTQHPQTCLIVALSENDEIVNASKVRHHCQLHCDTNPHHDLRSIFWRDTGHAVCVTDPSKWRDIRTQMLESELDMVRQGS